jgi:predicted MFS family arabinose efflux permease
VVYRRESQRLMKFDQSSATYATFLLFLINIFNYVDRMILPVLTQSIKRDLHFSDTQMGLLSGFAFVGVYAAVGLPLARLADRAGRRRLLTGSIALWSLMSAAGAFTQSFAQLALARVGVGVGEAGSIPASHALLANIYPQERRAIPMSIVTAGAAVGIALGLGLGGLAGSRYGWRAAFVIVGLPGVLLAIIVGLTMPEPIRARNEIALQIPLWASIRALCEITTYRRTMFAHAFYLFVTAGTLNWLPAFFMRSHGMKLAHVGLFFGMTYGFGIGIGCFLGAYVLQTVARANTEKMLRSAGCLALVAFPFYVGSLLISSTSISLLLMLVFSALIGGAVSPIIVGQQGVVDDSKRAVASALSMFFASYLGGGVGPLLIGMASEHLAPSLGANALRAALLISSSAIILTGHFLFGASRSFSADARP